MDGLSLTRHLAPRAGFGRSDVPIRGMLRTTDPVLRGALAMTAPESFDAGVAHQIGHYADAVPVAVRSEFVKHEPASFLGVIPALVWPNLKVEIEVIAAVAAAGPPATPASR
jgi:hypothetical protein